jgi:hypothetical protein
VAARQLDLVGAENRPQPLDLLDPCHVVRFFHDIGR